MLEKTGFTTRGCSNMGDGQEGIQTGVGVIVLAEEALRDGAHSDIIEALDKQPSWSDIPVVLLLAQGELSRAIAPLVAEVATRGNVTLLERPVRVATLVTTLRSAL